MQARIDVYETLIRTCRMLRQSSDVERVRAVLDVEDELAKKLVAAGGTVPPTASELHPGRAVRRARRNLVAAGK
jgi:hypothetical protein